MTLLMQKSKRVLNQSLALEANVLAGSQLVLALYTWVSETRRSRQTYRNDKSPWDSHGLFV